MCQNKETIWKVKTNYTNLNKTMISELDLMSTHGTLTGSSREKMWLDFFRKIVPEKFNISQGVIIIDSKGKVSKEVDIAIYDSSYTPYVFKYNNLKFIPIEAVAVVIECKSQELKPKPLKKWIQSIEKLESSSLGLARMANNYCISETSKTQVRTKPLKILVSLKEYKNEESETGSVVKKLTDNVNDDKNNLEEFSNIFFDFVIYKDKRDTKNKENDKSDESKFKILVRNEDKELGYWAKYLNGKNNSIKLKFFEEVKEIDYKPLEIEEADKDKNLYRLKNSLKDLRVEENPFLTINFQLNQLLMILNNPMLFPHFAYAKMFDEISNENNED